MGGKRPRNLAHVVTRRRKTLKVDKGNRNAK